MHQQRQRRYRSAFEAEISGKGHGQCVNGKHVFEGTCITSGTEFMSRLNEWVKYYAQMKMSTDKAWERLKVIISGSDVPGEGEHKILSFIRNKRREKGYDPSTSHCIYGRDADLIMLTLLTHERNIVIMREELEESMYDDSPVDKNHRMKLQFLHVNMLREYLALEFMEFMGDGKAGSNSNSNRNSNSKEDKRKSIESGSTDKDRNENGKSLEAIQNIPSSQKEATHSSESSSSTSSSSSSSSSSSFSSSSFDLFQPLPTDEIIHSHTLSEFPHHESVILLPFVDSDTVIRAAEELYPKLSREEKERNEMGWNLVLLSPEHLERKKEMERIRGEAMEKRKEAIEKWKKEEDERKKEKVGKEDEKENDDEERKLANRNKLNELLV
ncbi:putative Evolutionarily-conserved 5'-3' exonuclease component of cytoplasmic processing [Monocercomonoides exilis]|uniref:putative Evolutionarily-conserved 5'-3' exonuclease component of cytoplasmic processing n=1 Tax=Monocercomonoides exilis TaxID=2049356 RepID=UPI00355956B6|nr:putative Evolutionarily-conserved 5'-3' exonuclease component of cytoplasmic processing [Monocercomonoides exilis]|eukprot:MONOS_14085.1-p1 / transcript=MONOS_14085.1 / gene=MONOS_14085 / organism=Monocercomonoides_exilis_PA203 / gene_product=Evolutionarily-conserved 5'-3' exonuclease component of cytoplasmic processing / transcript_product=Evolutionarily-conserved 5'-3' exonuclease component of cytoplasmic processing / location=Mono_scaffold00934:3785-4936(+) / protein_length=383 / sequence_SO=supercontig / SO=protein_coding / is_pseudo=false